MDREVKNCQNCKQPFVIEPEDFTFYERIQVPPPTFCPECREQRRIAIRNERALYKRKCDLCGKEVVSRVSPDKPYPMYCRDCWWSDKWDSLTYGRDYDFSKQFFTQFKELLFSVPQLSLFNGNMVNSDWVNQETDDKNCYLNVGGHYNENSGYNTYELYGKDSFDNFWLLNSEFCYEDINCMRCYRVFFSRNCFDSQNVYFSFDCRNCTDIIGCAGLRNKKFCIFNKQVSKEDYDKFLKENPLSSSEAVTKLTKESLPIWNSIPHRYSSVIKSVNSTGNNISESKNAHNVWEAERVEDSKYLFISGWVKDSYDETSHGASELSYECSSGGGVYGSSFLAYCMGTDPLKQMHSFYLEYCFNCVECEHCFGCVGLRNKKYCIFNKVYKEEEYKEIVPKIKNQMNKLPYTDGKGRIYRYGEFFPAELALFGYNESAGMDYYPLSREEALAKGFLWSDYEVETKHEFSDYRIPDDIKGVKDDILEKVLKCEVSGKPYRLIPMELQFYRRLGLPVPRLAPLQRHKDRMEKLLPRRLFERTCECQGGETAQNGYKNTATHQHGAGKCGTGVSTPYAPSRPELIYCEQCYQAEIS
ncbi:MAG: hypothetical protein ABSF47_03870 [Minisyncoccia bacterium]|jgi:hypothetical protein